MRSRIYLAFVCLIDYICIFGEFMSFAIDMREFGIYLHVVRCFHATSRGQDWRSSNVSYMSCKKVGAIKVMFDGGICVNIDGVV